MPSVPSVFTYGPDGSGARASEFKVGNVAVVCKPMFAEGNEAAFELACKFAQHDLEVERLTAERDAFKARVVVQRAKPSRLLGTGYVRFRGNEIWVLNNRERGFGEFGFRFESWDEVFRDFDVRVTGHGTDEHGEWWSVESTKAVG